MEGKRDNEKQPKVKKGKMGNGEPKLDSVV
jgi:hypothetical protein